MAAEQHAGNLTFEEGLDRAKDALVLSDRQLKQNRAMGQNVDAIRQKITELVNQVVSFLIPHTSRLVKQVAEFLIPPIVSIARKFGFRGPSGEPLPEVSPRLENAYRAGTVNRLGSDAGALPPGARRAIQGVQSGGITRPTTRSEAVQSLADQQGVTNPARLGTEQQALYQAFIPRTSEGIVGRQRGGRVRPGEATLVGEEGPEIARFPAGTEIVPNRDIRGAQGGPTTITQTFYVTIVNPSSELDIERSLAEAAGKVTPDA